MEHTDPLVIGSRISVWWPREQEWYEGNVRDATMEIASKGKAGYTIVVEYDGDAGPPQPVATHRLPPAGDTKIRLIDEPEDAPKAEASSIPGATPSSSEGAAVEDASPVKKAVEVAAPARAAKAASAARTANAKAAAEARKAQAAREAEEAEARLAKKRRERADKAQAKRAKVKEEEAVADAAKSRVEEAGATDDEAMAEALAGTAAEAGLSPAAEGGDAVADAAPEDLALYEHIGREGRRVE